jgi:hypothetical protein
MHKPTPPSKNHRLKSASTLSMRFSREIRTLDYRRVRFAHSDRKVPAAYFPLLRNEPTKTSRKTAHRVRRVESTCLSKKIKQWKVQTAQKTRRNSPSDHARLESGHSNHRNQVTRFCATYVLTTPYLSLFTIRNSPFICCLPLMVIFSQKTCALISKPFTSVSQVLVSPILRAVYLSRRPSKTLVKRSFVICEAKSDFA